MRDLLPDLETGRRFLLAQGATNSLLVGITGAHYYGFASRDSDLDMKGIHVAATAAVVSLSPPPDTIDSLGQFDGVEIDYTSHELAFALKLLLKGNGNILERILSPFQVLQSPHADEVQALARAAVSKKFLHHYRGFFGRMREDCRKAPVKTAKGLLYAYRSALTGIHLLATGECVGDVSLLAPRYGFERVSELLERKRSGVELAHVDDTVPYESDWPRLEKRLDDSFATTRLPEQAKNAAALSDYLVRQRRRCFD